LVAAYRTLRLIDEAGLTLWVGDIQTAAASLSKDAIRFLADRDVPDATGMVLRTRTENSIAEWYTRRRIATLASTDVDRLRSIAYACLSRLAESPDALTRDTDQTRQFAATVELLSRAAIRADDSALKDLLRFTMTLPTKLQIWKRWWLVEGLNTLTRRICDAMSNAATVDMLPEVVRSAVAGSESFPCPSDHVRWVDPAEMLERDGLFLTAQRSPAVAKAIDSVIGRLLEIADDTNHKSERRYLVLRVVMLANRGLLDSDQQEGFAKALFASRDSTTGLPIDTGCLDSVVLVVPPVAGVDEHSLFNAKYVVTPWPTDAQPLCSLLGSLARTGPVVKTRFGGRTREIDWSTAELREIAARCCSTMEEQANVVLSAAADAGGFHPLRKWLRSPVDWANTVAKLIAEVIDEVLIQREVVPPEVWDPIVAAINHATQVGLPVLRVYPKLASFESPFRNVLSDEIVSLLSCNNEDRVMDGLLAINHWANQLDDSRIPRIPEVVIASVRGHLDGEYSHTLIDILDTIRNLLARLSIRQSRRLLQQCETPLGRWARLLTYKADGHLSELVRRMRAELPDLRASMTRLCAVARSRAIRSDAVTAWLESVSNDPMPEIRRALSEPDS